MNGPLSPHDPPNYDAPYSTSSNGTSRTNVSEVDGYTSTVGSRSLTHMLSAIDSGDDVVADQRTQSWEETLLNNVHKLENLTFTSNEMSNAVHQSVYFTKEIGEIGVEPTIFDPSKCEYAPGEYLNGFVLLENTLDVPIPFDMYYVLFEGNYIFGNPKENPSNPIRYERFLEMYDLSASYNMVHVTRLASEVPDHLICDGLYDERDNTYLTLSNRLDRSMFGNIRMLLPGRKYKRFFNFKIPERLLDSECQRHSLSTHIELPPTVGKCHIDSAKKEFELKEFAPKNVSVSYSVMTRFIGKRSLYEANYASKSSNRSKLVSDKGDEFIILKETNDAIRIVPKHIPQKELYLQMKSKEQDLMVQNLKNRLEERINAGNRLLEAIKADDFNESIAITKETESADLLLAKLLQQYRESRLNDDDDPNSLKFYKVEIPIIAKKQAKKALLSNFMHKSTLETTMGVFGLNTPASTYRIPYIPSKPFRTQMAPIELEKLKKFWKVVVPIELQFKNNSKSSDFKGPRIKFIKATLVVTTLKSQKYPIALEFKHDLIFNQKQYPPNSDVHAAKFGSKDPDTFEANLKNSFREISLKLYKCLKTLPEENFQVCRSLTDDIKLICHIEDETVELPINQLSLANEAGVVKCFNSAQSSIEACKAIEQMEWKKKNADESSSSSTYHKQLEVSLNLDTANILGTRLQEGFSTTEEFTLIPGFQNCYMSRFYAIKLMLITVDDQIISVKVPLSIERS
ncbi:uncharacterized protein KQ657_000470 [Scheffersomyces spartinae]|uniref:Bul1 N-terminal domain-containing protein n=1 Tax=Scheffersomyces spartinae TaxID=45513 RepID=A0A9P7VAE1_9ASCO|nr:uncharacterized protein KQ657_000470 [Scheffersomyces spartinae]KAG7193778.1 hypothetical protein KQ657_000470 [Scheffersomyces spartinae]